MATYCGATEGAGQPELSREKELVQGGGCSRRGKGPNEGLQAGKPGLAGDSEVSYGWTPECRGDQQDAGYEGPCTSQAKGLERGRGSKQGQIGVLQKSLCCCTDV